MQHLPRKHFDFRGQQCLNCETPLEMADKFCHQCGQLNTTKRLALKDFFQEFFASFISYDSKLWRTVTTLLFKPGRVTKEYCAGKRTQYANPFRFFLTVSIVFFLIIQLGILVTGEDFTAGDRNAIEINFENENGITQNLNDSIASKEEVLKLLRMQRDSLNGAKNFIQKAAMDAAIEKIASEDVTINSIEEYSSQEELDTMAYLDNYEEQLSDYMNFFEKHKEIDPEKALHRLKHRKDELNISRYKKAVKLRQLVDDPIEITNILLPKIPLFLFFFAPFMSLFFWLIYIRGPWNYMEHMVFNFHLLSFIFLSMYVMASELFLFDTSFIATLFFVLIGPFYLYMALRKFYGQGRFKTIIKFLLINLAFVILLSISSTLFVLGSILASV